MIKALHLSDVAPDLHGQISGDNNSFSRVVTDSRLVSADDLFVAICGERFDGHAFIESLPVDKNISALVSADVGADISTIKVADTVLALGQLGAINRQLFNGKVIGITGSAGKTTTKEMIAAILQQNAPVLFTQGNLNNEIGTPMTLLSIESGHQFAVIEMGAAKQGDIRYLADFVKPDVAIITNAMAAHLASFGSVQTVAETKGEIYQSLSDAGMGIVNIDDEYSSLWLSFLQGKQVYTFSLHNAEADFFAQDINCISLNETEFTVQGLAGEAVIKLQTSGTHNITNALGAIATAFALSIPLEQIMYGLAEFSPVKGRLNIKQGVNGCTVIDDSYNANPQAMKAAIDVLCSSAAVNKMLVIGDMAELGCTAEQLHQEVAVYALEKGVNQLFSTGRYADVMAQAFGNNAQVFSDKNELIAELQEQLTHNDIVLVKASHSAGFEIIAEALMSSNTEEIH